MDFIGPSQKNTLSSVYMLQSKALHFHYFILKMPYFLQFFDWPRMTFILLQGQFHHLVYHDRVNKKVLLIFQLTFVQDSQMLLLPQVQNIVTQFLNVTWCVQLMQIIATCVNTGKELIHQTLKPAVWFYAASMIRIFFIPLTAVRWLKLYAHLKIIFNGISSSYLPVTWENVLVHNQFVNDFMITNGQCIFPIGIHTIFFSSKK